jgi:hypothetical protein
MMSERERENVRMEAMTAFLLDRVREGYAIETHTDTHAIIGPAGRWSWLNPFRKASGRHVVSVDADGNVTMRDAEPLRS